MIDYIIYHNKDLDGITSAALGLLNQDLEEKKPVLIGFDYGDDLDIRKFRGKTVLMVDVSLPIERMVKLANISKKLTWVDHHQSAFEEFHNELESIYDLKETKINGMILEYEIEDLNLLYYYSSVFSACELMYQLFVKSMLFSNNSGRIVSLLGQYDTWRNTAGKKLMNDESWKKNVLPFQWGMREFKDPQVIADIIKNTPEKVGIIMNTGKSILKYQKGINEFAMKRSFEFELPNGYRVLALNQGGCNSLTFESKYHEDIHDLVMPFVFDGVKDTWSFSMYTTKNDIDILNIAKLHDGGGHKQACGFSTNLVLINKDKIKFLTLEK